MFYKTKKTSETGKKFTDIIKKRDRALKQQRDFCEKYDFTQYRQSYWGVWGGITSCANFKETPDKKIWGKGEGENEFFPKKNSKIGKQIAQEIENLFIVRRIDLNRCIGMEENFNQIGFSDNNENFYGFSTNKKWGVEIPEDCDEILESEFDKLFNIS